jgi:thiol-disulfide isomerase/thioredoxin
MSNPRSRRELLTLAGTVTAALAGCVGGGDDEGADNGDDGEMGEDGGTDGGNPDSSGTGDSGSMARPSWQTATLEDVTTGETFSLAEFDRPVVLHTFATWCPKCRSQQESIDAFLADAGDSAVAVDLTIDENDDPETLREHAESNGFDWRFGVSPSSVTSAMIDEFGREVASAPQSPVIIVCPGGESHAIDKGVGPDQLAAEIESNC